MTESSPSAGARMLRAGVGLLAVMAAGTAARLVAWSRIVTDDGVRLASDSDPYYHVLQAQRVLSGDAVWFDPALNWPHGSTVLWPPLFDALLAGAARLVAGPTPSLRSLELAAAAVPVVLGVLTLVLVMAIGTITLGPRRGVVAALLLAVLPAHAFFSSIGVADQHVAEVLLTCAIVLAFAAGTWARASWSRRVARGVLAVVVAAAFWNWQGAALALAIPVVFAGAAYAFLGAQDEATGRAARTLAAGAGVGAVALAATVVAWGAPSALRQGSIHGVTGLHVAIAAGAAAFGLALLVAGRSGRTGASSPRRVLEVVAMLAVVGALAVAALPTRAGVAHGFAALGAANPWYAEIEEFRRLVFSCRYSVTDDVLVLLRTFGLTFVAAGFAVPALVRRARAGGRDRAVALFLACWGVPFLVLALARVRFTPYATIPLALLASEGIWSVARWVESRGAGGRARARPWIAAALAVVTIAPVVPTVARGVTPMPEVLVDSMKWLRSQPARPGAEGVLATWDLGHLVLYFARKPVVASPFGTDAGVDSMVDAARFDLSTSGAQASAILAERRVGFVVLSDPLVNAAIDQGFVAGLPGFPPVVERRCSFGSGRSLEVFDAFWSSTAARLFYFDGQAAPGRGDEALGTLRLVHESRDQAVKIFESVPGAVLAVSGAAPFAEVTASVYLRTNAGRQIGWTTRSRADARGEALLRVPYASGGNGAVYASSWLVRAGERVTPVSVPASAVASGAVTRVDAG